MPIITDRAASLEIFHKAVQYNTSIAVFCTASHWNTEAILIAANRIANKYGLEYVPVVISTTFQYRHMPQAKRFLFCGDPIAGFYSHIRHLHTLVEGKYAPYRNVAVLPHIDHADPIDDLWALTVALPYVSSVMFDAQHYPYRKNLEITSEYVKHYGNQVLIEGVIEELDVGGSLNRNPINDYCEMAENYFRKTNVDFIVADLGTEQQSLSNGKAVYNQEKAQKLTKVFQKKVLALHGTSCLTNNQIKSLIDDGIIRVNVWTRIVREAGQYAAERLCERIDNIRNGEFEATESNTYIRDNVEKAADIMTDMMELFGYRNWFN
jgi:fructose/tagatose bisphosphate aldolase